MKKLLICLLIILWATVASAASSVTFEWDANPENDLAGYRLYQSNQSGVYGQTPISVIPAGTETVVLDISDGTYFWVLTAFDDNGNESTHSNEVTKSLDSIPPGAPTQLLIRIVVKITVN
jgi:fibronectin type 3 domain-containing protein